MSQYNEQNVIYNRDGENGGASYNAEHYIRLIKLNEKIQAKETINSLTVIFSMLEKFAFAQEGIDINALFENLYPEGMVADDEVKSSILFRIAESFGIKDEMLYLTVLATLNEKISLLQQLELVVELFQEQELQFKEELDLTVFFEMLDKFKLQDLKQALFATMAISDRFKMLETKIDEYVKLKQTDEFWMDDKKRIALTAFMKETDKFTAKELDTVLKAFLPQYDTFAMTDREPRRAISDFMIGNVDDLERAYDWLIPFNLMVDWDETDIPIMPRAELTTIEIPGVDGSIVADSVYKDRVFKIAAYTQDGLTAIEKEEMKTKITQILDSTKYKSKKLTVQTRGTSFDVRYEGDAKITPGPSFVKAVIPFHTTPYGRDMFDSEIKGAGLVFNEGDTATGPKHIIEGPIQTPIFYLGAVSYQWNGFVPEGKRLIIDHQRKTCYVEDNFGNKTNGLAKLAGNFQMLPAHTSTVLNAPDNVAKALTTTWYNRVLW